MAADGQSTSTLDRKRRPQSCCLALREWHLLEGSTKCRLPRSGTVTTAGLRTLSQDESPVLFRFPQHSPDFPASPPTPRPCVSCLGPPVLM